MDLISKFCDSWSLLQIDSLSKTVVNLRNIASGLILPTKVNITNLKKCGESIFENMEGTCLLTFSFKKVIQAVQIPSSSSILAKETKVALDPEFYFQRFTTVCLDDDQKDNLKHEFAYHPMSLFNDEGFMQNLKKSELGNYIVGKYIFHDVIPNIESEQGKKVVDGGMLLHRLPWQVGRTFFQNSIHI